MKMENHIKAAEDLVENTETPRELVRGMQLDLEAPTLDESGREQFMIGGNTFTAYTSTEAAAVLEERDEDELIVIGTPKSQSTVRRVSDWNSDQITRSDVESPEFRVLIAA